MGDTSETRMQRRSTEHSARVHTQATTQHTAQRVHIGHSQAEREHWGFSSANTCCTNSRTKKLDS